MKRLQEMQRFRKYLDRASTSELQFMLVSISDSMLAESDPELKSELQWKVKQTRDQIDALAEDRPIVLFDVIGRDGALATSTLRREIARIASSMYSDATAELYELNYGRAIRRFALTNLLPHQRGRFLNLAGVGVSEGVYEAEIARLTSSEAYERMYADDFDAQWYADRFSELFAQASLEGTPRIPNADEWLFDHEICIGCPVKAASN